MGSFPALKAQRKMLWSETHRVDMLNGNALASTAAGVEHLGAVQIGPSYASFGYGFLRPRYDGKHGS